MQKPRYEAVQEPSFCSYLIFDYLRGEPAVLCGHPLIGLPKEDADCIVHFLVRGETPSQRYLDELIHALRRPMS